MSYTQSNSQMEMLSWIVDRWISTDGETNSYEHWEKAGDNLFVGGSETVKNGDTVFAEKLKIELIEGTVYYIADVSHNLAPVRFKLTQINENSAVFENPEHNFPQKISYRLVDGTTLHAAIEGPSRKGEWKKIDFIMNRMR